MPSAADRMRVTVVLTASAAPTTAQRWVSTASKRRVLGRDQALRLTEALEHEAECALGAVLQVGEGLGVEGQVQQRARSLQRVAAAGVRDAQHLVAKRSLLR